MSAASAKQLAAQAALKRLPTSGVIGLGSGSTARLFIQGVGELVRTGRQFVGVPTSEGSRELAVSLGIPLLGDSGPWRIDVCVDGADEVSETLDLIKGGGACHTREKIVNYAARTNLIIVDESKLSRRLGERWPVPVEVLPFGQGSTREHLSGFGNVTLRERDGHPRLTDAGNFIYDVNCGVIEDPAALDRALKEIPGVVDTGLFVARADAVIVAGENGVRTLTRK